MRTYAVPRLLLALALLPLALSCGDTPTQPEPAADPRAGTGAEQPRSEGVRLLLVSGGAQTGVAGQPLADPVVVRVVDVNDRPVASATLNFIVATGGGSAAPDQAQTDTAGTARTLWTLGAAAGEQTLRVSGTGGTQVVVTATATPPPPAVARVRVQPDSLALMPGETGDFSVVAYGAQDQVLTGRPVAWASSDTTVARIDAGGRVTAAAAGTARITATVEGVRGEAVVHVRIPRAAVARVVVHPDSLVLQPGQTGDFTASAFAASGELLTGRAVAWASLDSSVVRIDGRGTVTARAAGTARITATVEGVRGEAVVHVRIPRAAVARVVVHPDSLVLQPGQTGDFTASAVAAAGELLTGRAVVWASLDSSLVRIDGRGTVTARAAGTARITATVEGVRGEAVVHVRIPRAAVARVVVQPDSLVLTAGQTGKVSAVAYDAGGNVLTGRAVAWTSDYARAATVDAQGTVAAVAEGSARITATVEGVAGHATVRVRAARSPVAQLSIYPDSLTLMMGQSAALAARGWDAQGWPITDRPVAWGSSDAAVARVDAQGTVTAVAEGSVRISATVDGLTAYARVQVRRAVLPGVKVPLIQMRPATPMNGLLDVSRHALDLNFWIHTTEAVTSVGMRIRSPGGRVIECERGFAEHATYREFRCSLTIPARSDPGLWRVDQVRLTRGSETRTLDRADLDQMQTAGRAFDIVGDGSDTSPPEVRTMVPRWRDSGYFWLQFGLIDHVNGVREATATVRNLDTGQRLTCQARSSNGALPRGADWLCPLDVPPGSRWTVESVTATDAGGHTASWTAAQIAAWRGVFEMTFIDFDFTA